MSDEIEIGDLLEFNDTGNVSIVSAIDGNIVTLTSRHRPDDKWTNDMETIKNNFSVIGQIKQMNNKICPMEKGPWRVAYDDGDPYLMSDDFEHDVILSISGDFADRGQKTEYTRNPEC